MTDRRLLVVLLFSLIMPAFASARDCALTRIDGNPVALWAQGVWRPAEPGPLTHRDAVLRTGPEARAEIVCNDGLVLTVGIATEVTLETLLAPDSPGILLKLYRGILGLVAPRPREGGTAVLGTLAIAAARSTEWLVAVEASGATATFVRTGRVEVTPVGVAGGPALLGPGEGRDIGPEGAGPVVTWGAPRVAASRAALGFGWR